MKRRLFGQSISALTTALCLAVGLISLPAAAETKLRVFSGGQNQRPDLMRKLFDSYQAKNPGVTIEIETGGATSELQRQYLSTVLNAKDTAIDIYMIDIVNPAQYFNAGWLEPLDSYVGGAQALKPYLPVYSQANLVNGKVAAMPAFADAMFMYYRKDLLEKHGIKEPKTWDELFALGKPFRKANGPQSYALDGELYDMVLLSQAWVQQNYGQAYIDPTEPRIQMSNQAALDWVKTYKRLIDEQVATPLPHRASLGGAEKPTEQQPDWVTGQWAGNYTWDSVINLRKSTMNKQQNLNLGPFPTLKGAKDSGMFGRPTLMYAIGKNSRHAEAAAKLIHFLATDGTRKKHG